MERREPSYTVGGIVNWLSHYGEPSRGFLKQLKIELPYIQFFGTPGGSDDKASICLQHGRCGFDPWVMKTPLEKEMATHSRTLAWKISWTEESGRLQSMGSQRVGHN